MTDVYMTHFPADLYWPESFSVYFTINGVKDVIHFDTKAEALSLLKEWGFKPA